MVWNVQKDVVLCREILLMEPYKFKVRSRDRRKIWKDIAEHLNSSSTEELFFRVDMRAVRERPDVLIKNFQNKLKEQTKASGINPVPTELDNALESIIERMHVCEEEILQAEKETETTDVQDKTTAEDLRKRALETFQETRVRKKQEEEEGETSIKRRRSRELETLDFLRQKSEDEQKLRRE